MGGDIGEHIWYMLWDAGYINSHPDARGGGRKEPEGYWTAKNLDTRKTNWPNMYRLIEQKANVSYLGETYFKLIDKYSPIEKFTFYKVNQKYLVGRGIITVEYTLYFNESLVIVERKQTLEDKKKPEELIEFSKDRIEVDAPVR